MENKKPNPNKALIICIILALISIVLLTSCGAVKKDKTEIKESEVKTEQTTEKVVTNSETNTKIIDTSTTDEIEFIPIDNSKPIVINGKTYSNVQIKKKRNKNNISTNKVEKVSQIKEKHAKIESKASKQVWQKQVERESWFKWWFWLLLLIPIYYLYKKIKPFI